MYPFNLGIGNQVPYLEELERNVRIKLLHAGTRETQRTARKEKQVLILHCQAFDLSVASNQESRSPELLAFRKLSLAVKAQLLERTVRMTELHRCSCKEDLLAHLLENLLIVRHCRVESHLGGLDFSHDNTRRVLIMYALLT